MATWEIVIMSVFEALSEVFHWLNGNSVFSTGVYAGGFAGLFWSFLITCILSAPIVASLAEMDSMAPTSGGQYH